MSCFRIGLLSPYLIVSLTILIIYIMTQQSKGAHQRPQYSSNQTQSNFILSNQDSTPTSRNISKITFQTRRTDPTVSPILDVQDQIEPLPFQTEEAKKNVHRLHGINFGRSLTLEDDSYVIMKNKSQIIKILVLIGLICIAVIGLGGEKQKPTKRASAKRKGDGKKKTRPE